MDELRCHPRELVRSLNRFAPNLPDRTLGELRQILGRDDVIKLSFNESTYGPSPRAIKAMQAAAANVNVYHDPEGKAVRGKLAERYGVAPDMVLLANGADEVILLLGMAYIGPGDEAIVPSPTFYQYVFATKVAGGEAVRVPVKDDLTMDLAGISAAITDRTKIIFLCNPNNPTGVMLPGTALRDWLSGIPENIVVVLDEAYAEYVTDPAYVSGLDLMKEFQNVVVIRTFSKIYAMPALRLGYAIAHPGLIEAAQRVRSPFNVNMMGHVAALAALDDPEFHRDVKEKNTAEREWLTQQLTKLGWKVYPSQTNFLFVDTGVDGGEICQQLAACGIIIRPAAGWGYPSFVRISLGDHEQNVCLVKSLQEIVK